MDTIPQDNTPRKQCTGPCGQFLPATTEYFYRRKKGSDVLRSKCQDCEHAWHKDYDQVYAQDYNQRPEVRERRRIRERERRKRPDVQAYRRAYFKIYWQTYGSAYQSRPEVQQRTHAYHQIYDPIWRKRPEAHTWLQTYSQNRRARKKHLPGTLTQEQIRVKLSAQHYACYYCFTKFEKRKGKYDFQLEHTVPVGRPEAGPRHDVNFVVLACPTCNRKKNNKLPHEFPEGGRLL